MGSHHNLLDPPHFCGGARGLFPREGEITAGGEFHPALRTFLHNSKVCMFELKWFSIMNSRFQIFRARSVVLSVLFGALLGVGLIAPLHIADRPPLAEAMNLMSANTSDAPQVEELPAPALASVEVRDAIFAHNPARYGDDGSFNPHPRVAPGQTASIETVSDDGVARRYILHVGANYSPAHPMPVLFAFHGWKVSPEDFLQDSRLSETPAWNDAIVVYPEGLAGAWEGAPYAVGGEGADFRFVRKIVDEVDREYRIDRNRVYAAGMSNGGGLATAVGCRMPEVFAAVAAVSAAYYFPTLGGCIGAPMPGLYIHSTGDSVINYAGGIRHGAAYYPARVASDFQAMRNGCRVFDSHVSGFPGGERFVYQGCRAETQHIRVDNRPHVWNVDPVVPHEVWGFLSRHSK